MIQFYDLPFIRECKEAFQNPRNHEYPQKSYLAEQLNTASNKLFCISEYDTFLDEDDPRDYGEYELNFAVCDMPAEQAQPLWHAMGWDLTGPDGRELDVADEFKRQIIACAKGLVDGAEFCPEGNGKPAYDYDGNRISGTETFEQSLKAELEQWRTDNAR